MQNILFYLSKTLGLGRTEALMNYSFVYLLQNYQCGRAYCMVSLVLMIHSDLLEIARKRHCNKSPEASSRRCHALNFPDFTDYLHMRDKYKITDFGAQHSRDLRLLSKHASKLVCLVLVCDKIFGERL